MRFLTHFFLLEILMSITEIRPCTTFASQISFSEYTTKGDPVQHAVNLHTTEEDFIKVLEKFKSLKIAITQGSHSYETVLFQAARYRNLKVVRQICEQEPKLVALGNW